MLRRLDDEEDVEEELQLFTAAQDNLRDRGTELILKDKLEGTVPEAAVISFF